MSGEIGTARIAMERMRQIDKEGFSPEHDKKHNDSSLLLAAIAYIDEALGVNDPDSSPYESGIPGSWPWEASWWKPSEDAVRNLEKAGALIAAEIDRLIANA